MTTENSITDARIALQTGDKPHARMILDALIRQNPQDDQAWVLLAQTVENSDQARACLERATQINPANDEAWQRMSELERQEPRLVHPQVSRPDNKLLPGKQQAASRSRLSKRHIAVIALVAIGSIALLAIVLIAIGVFGWTRISDLAILPFSGPAIQGNPQDFCLTLTDLPDGFEFSAENSGPATNEEVASSRENPKEFLEMLGKYGRIEGHETAFERYHRETDWIRIMSSVVMMETVRGARDYFKYLENEWSQLGYLSVSVPLIGDESIGLVSSYLGTPVNKVSFRNNNVLVTISVIGEAPELAEEAVRYAQILESKLSGDITSTPVTAETLFPLGSWQNPAPIGSSFTLEDSTGQFVYTTKLLDIARGELAYQIAQGESDGTVFSRCLGMTEQQECIAIKVNMILEEAPRGEMWSFMPAMHIDLRFRDTLADPIPESISTVGNMTDEQYPPIEWEGWIFYEIQRGDDDLLIYFQPNLILEKENGILKSGVYFELNSD